MKSTGIVRRLDDLGRLVIPKEIRKQFRLKEGDSIEFYIDQDKIIIQKFDLLSRYEEEIKIAMNPPKAELLSTIKEIKRANPDFAIVVFSGHGAYQR
ncbi:MAG: AbrB/MazE/SpoVT family DNA-binding domain-containing protein, partial [Erysipelotrichaceae bacterium]